MISQIMAQRIERFPIDKLVPYPRNARRHSEEQIAQVAASIAEFGFVNPVLIGPDNRIVAGHARVAAARQLGMLGFTGKQALLEGDGRSFDEISRERRKEAP